MNKLVASFVVAFMLLSIVCSIFDGGGGLVSTSLTASVTSADVNWAVDNTTTFLGTGILFCEDEKVLYASTNATHFIGLTRGYEETDAAAHYIGRVVYCEDAGIVNAALGFNAAAIAATSGYAAAVLIPWKFFTITMPRLVLWNFNIFTGDLVIVRYLLMGLSICFYIAFAINIGSLISNLLPWG